MLPGPHHDRPARPLTDRERAALSELEIRAMATSSKAPLGQRCRRFGAIVAGALAVVLVLVVAGALLGPAGIALGSAGLVTAVLGMVLRDLMRSGLPGSRPAAT